jgi:hypothetical protein
MKPEKYKFKVLTMSDKVVQEEFYFEFFQHNGGVKDETEKNTQKLLLSRNLDKLMESYSDSSCKIYQKK